MLIYGTARITDGDDPFDAIIECFKIWGVVQQIGGFYIGNSCGEPQKPGLTICKMLSQFPRRPIGLICSTGD